MHALLVKDSERTKSKKKVDILHSVNLAIIFMTFDRYLLHR